MCSNGPIHKQFNQKDHFNHFSFKTSINYFKWSRKSKPKISTLQQTIFLLALNNKVWICLFVPLDQQVEWSKIVTFEGSNIDKIAWPITRLWQPLGCYRVWVQIQSMSPFSLYWLIWFLTLGKQTHSLWGLFVIVNRSWMKMFDMHSWYCFLCGSVMSLHFHFSVVGYWSCLQTQVIPMWKQPHQEIKTRLYRY